jgi:hypothetical protein
VKALISAGNMVRIATFSGGLALIWIWSQLLIPVIFALFVAPPIAFIIVALFVALPAFGVFVAWQKARELDQR